MTTSAGFINGVTKGAMGIYSSQKTNSASYSFSGTTIQASFASDFGSVLGNSSSRINFTDLTTTISQNITEATNTISIIIPGNYLINIDATIHRVADDLTAVIQIVKNAGVLSAASSNVQSGNEVSDMSNTTVSPMAVGDTIDFRLLNIQTGTYTFSIFSVNIIQLFDV